MFQILYSSGTIPYFVCDLFLIAALMATADQEPDEEQEEEQQQESANHRSDDDARLIGRCKRGHVAFMVRQVQLCVFVMTTNKRLACHFRTLTTDCSKYRKARSRTTCILRDARVLSGPARESTTYGCMRAVRIYTGSFRLHFEPHTCTFRCCRLYGSLSTAPQSVGLNDRKEHSVQVYSTSTVS